MGRGTVSNIHQATTVSATEEEASEIDTEQLERDQMEVMSGANYDADSSKLAGLDMSLLKPGERSADITDLEDNETKFEEYTLKAINGVGVTSASDMSKGKNTFLSTPPLAATMPLALPSTFVASPFPSDADGRCR